MKLSEELLDYIDGAEESRGHDGRLTRWAERASFMEKALGEDAAGRPFAELLDQAARYLNDGGGGPMADCLRLKADEIRAAASEMRHE